MRLKSLADAVGIESFDLLEETNAIDLHVEADHDWRADFFLNAVRFWLPVFCYLRSTTKTIWRKKNESEKKIETTSGEKEITAQT